MTFSSSCTLRHTTTTDHNRNPLDPLHKERTERWAGLWVNQIRTTSRSHVGQNNPGMGHLPCEENQSKHSLSRAAADRGVERSLGRVCTNWICAVGRVSRERGEKRERDVPFSRLLYDRAGPTVWSRHDWRASSRSRCARSPLVNLQALTLLPSAAA